MPFPTVPTILDGWFYLNPKKSLGDGLSLRRRNLSHRHSEHKSYKKQPAHVLRTYTSTSAACCDPCRDWLEAYFHFWKSVCTKMAQQAKRQDLEPEQD